MRETQNIAAVPYFVLFYYQVKKCLRWGLPSTASTCSEPQVTVRNRTPAKNVTGFEISFVRLSMYNSSVCV